MANTQTAETRRPVASRVAARAADIQKTETSRAALESKDDVQRYSEDAAKANEQAKAGPKEPEQLTEADHLLKDTASKVLEFVKEQKVDERHHEIAWAVLAFLRERQRKTNGNFSMTLKEIRQHTFQLVNYKQSKLKDENKRQESPAFEMLVTRGIREGLLVFQQHKDAQLIRDEDSGAVMFMMPSNKLTPKVTLINPDTGKPETTMDNPKTELVKVPVAKIGELFNEAFPGNQRAANRKGEKETDTDHDEGDKLGKVSTIKLAEATTLRIVGLQTKLEEEGKKPNKEIIEQLSTLFDTLDHFLGLLDAAGNESSNGKQAAAR